jgi:hypothetical protein
MIREDEAPLGAATDCPEPRIPSLPARPRISPDISGRPVFTTSGPDRHLAQDEVKTGAELTAEAARPAHRRMIGVAGGTGFGCVTGRTEGNNIVQKCCIGSVGSAVHLNSGISADLRASIAVGF